MKVYLQEHGGDTIPNRDGASAVASNGHIGQSSACLSTNLVTERVKVVV